MSLTVERMDARPRIAEHSDMLFAEGWPGVVPVDPELAKFVDRAREYFPALELALLHDDFLVASAMAVPVCWSGDPAEIPSGYTGSLLRAVVDHESGIEPDTLVIMATLVRPDMRGRGLVAELLIAMNELAEAQGLVRVIAPVRPALKAQYPLTPIETYATWTEPDGAPLDQLVRTHWRLGARFIGTAPESVTMTATVTDWESWTKMALPSSGQYVIPEGLSVLNIDLERDRGIYIEPNIWMQHR
jgi:GNAT superfamily N-acetyltransferase